MKHLTSQFGHTDPTSEKEKITWLLLHLVGKDLVEVPRDLPEQLVIQIKDLLNSVAAAHSDVAERYKNLAGKYVRNRSFYRKKSQIEGIITNLLKLLGWMGERHVALRDIKPDNLLVAGDLESHPMFLASAKDYVIGLIDVETAVVVVKNGQGKINQPQLGGTPLYATPTHFFTNDLLQDLYKDVSRILILQDWYAITGIIYELITGEKLFLKTANKIHHIVRHLRHTDEIERNLPKVYWNFSRIFWETAVVEFSKKMNRAKHKLNAVHVTIPGTTKKWFENDWIGKTRGSDYMRKIIACTEHDQAQLSAYILLKNLFNIILGNMVANQPKAVATDVAESDTDKKEDLTVESESDRHVLGFTFTL